jgi:hypothetical protein
MAHSKGDLVSANFNRDVRFEGVIRPDQPSTNSVEGREPDEALDPSREAAHIRFLLMRKTLRG